MWATMPQARWEWGSAGEGSQLDHRLRGRWCKRGTEPDQMSLIGWKVGQRLFLEWGIKGRTWILIGIRILVLRLLRETTWLETYLEGTIWEVQFIGLSWFYWIGTLKDFQLIIYKLIFSCKGEYSASYSDSESEVLIILVKSIRYIYISRTFWKHKYYDILSETNRIYQSVET